MSPADRLHPGPRALLPVAAFAMALAGCDGGAADARAVATTGDAERGAVVFALAGGCGCHTPPEGPIGAGGVPIETPFGTFHSTNITPDRETGIGAWSDHEVARAIRSGVLRDGSVEAPVMPYPEYAGMADDDLRDLIAYLRTLEPARRRNRPHEVDLPLPRLAFGAWRMVFAGGATPPETAPRDGAARGRYLVDHVGICGDCHTPRNRFGAPERDMYLAGTAEGPEGEAIPNITSDDRTGIGDWDEADVVNLLSLGMMPNFDNVQGSMAAFVDGVAGGAGIGKAPATDLQAIAVYLKTVPPIHHEVRDVGADEAGGAAAERTEDPEAGEEEDR